LEGIPEGILGDVRTTCGHSKTSCNGTLSPTRITNTNTKLFKLTDGGGLFIEVSPGGAQTLRYQYRFGGARKERTIGKYPEVGIADADDKHFE
jgi:hypothetical protein